MLASRLWKSLLFSTHSSWGFSWVFCMRFAFIRIPFQFAFIDFCYWSLFWDSLLYCLVFCENQLFDIHRYSTDWLPHDVGSGSGCGKSRNRLLTVWYPFFIFFIYFFCLLVLYFYVAPSHLLFESFSCTRNFLST